MRKYETMFIINPDLQEEQRTALIESIKETITGNGGEILEVDEWGNRKLAYEINKKQTGYYVVIYFQAEAGTPEELERNYRIKDDIYRYIIIREEE